MELDPQRVRQLADKEWRVRNLYKVVDKDGKLVRFEPNNVQADFLARRGLRNIILKVRQLGFTTLACIDMLDECLFTKHINAVIIAHDKESLEKIFRRIHVAWEEFEKELGGAVGFSADASRANMLRFNNGSTISVTLSSRSDTVHILHISEMGPICAKYPHKAEEIITGAFPSVPSSGRITIESTADGESGWYHDAFWEGYLKPMAHHLDFRSFFYSWTVFPEYKDYTKIPLPEKFLDYQRKYNLTDEQIRWYYVTWRSQKEKMKENYPTVAEEAFEASGVKVFDAEMLGEQKVYSKEGVVNGGWIFFEEYNPVHNYVMGADPAEGIGKDSSSAHLIDLSWREKGHCIPKVVGVFCDNTVAPDIFAYELKRAGQMYGNALIAVERNGNGLATLTVLKQNYTNLYMDHRRGGMEDKETSRLGFLTTGASKPMIIYGLRTAINESDIIIPDRLTLQELREFQETHLRSTKYDPVASKHLDRVMSLAIAWEMRNFAGEGGPVYDGGFDNTGHQFDEHAGVEI